MTESEKTTPAQQWYEKFRLINDSHNLAYGEVQGRVNDAVFKHAGHDAIILSIVASLLAEIRLLREENAKRHQEMLDALGCIASNTDTTVDHRF